MHKGLLAKVNLQSLSLCPCMPVSHLVASINYAQHKGRFHLFRCKMLKTNVLSICLKVTLYFFNVHDPYLFVKYPHLNG